QPRRPRAVGVPEDGRRALLPLAALLKKEGTRRCLVPSRVASLVRVYVGRLSTRTAITANAMPSSASIIVDSVGTGATGPPPGVGVAGGTVGVAVGVGVGPPPPPIWVKTGGPGIGGIPVPAIV